MAILRGELQADNGDKLYPHTSSECVFAPDGKTVEQQINGCLGEIEKVKEQVEGIDVTTDIRNVVNERVNDEIGTPLNRIVRTVGDYITNSITTAKDAILSRITEINNAIIVHVSNVVNAARDVMTSHVTAKATEISNNTNARAAEIKNQITSSVVDMYKNKNISRVKIDLDRSNTTYNYNNPKGGYVEIVEDSSAEYSDDISLTIDGVTILSGIRLGHILTSNSSRSSYGETSFPFKFYFNNGFSITRITNSNSTRYTMILRTNK